MTLADDRHGGGGARGAGGVTDELVERAVRGDPAAVTRLLATVRPLVVRYCRARLGPGEPGAVSADDVAQEVCLALLRALPTYRSRGRPFLAFVYTVAASRLIDAHRAAGRRRALPVADVPDAPAPDDPEQHVLRTERAGALGRLLDELTDAQREIVVLRVALGLSSAATAEIVGSTPGAVRLAQHRALARLRAAAVTEPVA